MLIDNGLNSIWSGASRTSNISAVTQNGAVTRAGAVTQVGVSVTGPASKSSTGKPHTYVLKRHELLRVV